ncbi:MAG: hypothetical protein K2M44_01750 [Clostridia bacterium]|nr:hypothetical protein [Clostridia bacterium]
MTDLLSVAWSWQWADFVIAVVGSLFGFMFAILAAWGANKLIENSQRKDIIKLIKEDLELLDNDSIQTQTIEKIKEGTDIGHIILSLPHLERLVSTNQLILISKQKWFNEIMQLFSAMNEINKWYEKKSNFYFDNLLKLRLIDGRQQNNVETVTYQALCATIADEAKNNFYSKISYILKIMN